MLTLHADRGAAMRSKPVASLLVDLDVAKSHSRPHVSDDNPYSESQFKTMKYRPEFPDRFGCIEDARAHCQAFFAWYNDHALPLRHRLHDAAQRPLRPGRRRCASSARPPSMPPSWPTPTASRSSGHSCHPCRPPPGSTHHLRRTIRPHEPHDLHTKLMSPGVAKSLTRSARQALRCCISLNCRTRSLPVSSASSPPGRHRRPGRQDDAGGDAQHLRARLAAGRAARGDRRRGLIQPWLGRGAADRPRVQLRRTSGRKRTPARAIPPPMPTGVPSARQQAAPSSSPSSPNRIAPMPPPTLGTRSIAMAAPAQRVGDGVGERRFQLEAEALGPHPRRFHRLLQPHAVVDQVDHRLQRRREDPQAPRQPEREARLAVLQHDQRRHRRGHPLARRERVRPPRPRVEHVDVVVRDHPGAGTM